MRKKCFVAMMCIVVFMITSCLSTGYKEFYHARNDILTLKEIIPLNPSDKPIIRKSNNIENDYQELISDNWICLGYSGFYGRYGDTDEIRDQAREVGATLAIYNISYYETKTVMTSTQYNPYTKKLETTESNVDRYDHSVYYFVKSTHKFLIGISFKNLEISDREKAKRNTGVIVDVVYKNTPAFYGNLVRGDIIIKMNEKEVLNETDLHEKTKTLHAGDSVNIVVLRDNNEVTLTLKL